MRFRNPKTTERLQIAGACLLGLFCLVGTVWAIQGSDFILYRTFAPRYEAVRRETFEGSKAYRQGGAQELQAMQAQYVTASPEHKAALASIILHRAADFPEDAMSPDLRSFVADLKRERGLTK